VLALAPRSSYANDNEHETAVYSVCLLSLTTTKHTYHTLPPAANKAQTHQHDMNNRNPHQNGSHHDRNTLDHAPNTSAHTIYPARYFPSSPTYFAWNKLTATDLTLLRTHPGFEGQKIFFHLNHPIRFVRLVGLVVDLNVVGGKYILVTLDDGSGTCVDVKTECREEREGAPMGPSNTVVDNLDLRQRVGRFPWLVVGGAVVDIGTVIKVKGTIDSFRGARQIKLERIWVVKDTNEEAKCWAETALWKREVLSQPWVLSREKREAVDEQLELEAREERRRAQKKRVVGAEYERKKAEKIRVKEERRVVKERKLDKGALVGSSVLPDRITDG